MKHTHLCERCDRPYHCLQRQEKEITGPVCVTRMPNSTDDHLCWECHERIVRQLDEMAQGLEQA